jgi:hypothetical protein
MQSTKKFERAMPPLRSVRATHFSGRFGSTFERCSCRGPVT